MPSASIFVVGRAVADPTCPSVVSTSGPPACARLSRVARPTARTARLLPGSPPSAWTCRPAMASTTARRGASRWPSSTRWSARDRPLSRVQAAKAANSASLVDQAVLQGEQTEEQVARRVGRLGHGDASQSIRAERCRDNAAGPLSIVGPTRKPAQRTRRSEFDPRQCPVGFSLATSLLVNDGGIPRRSGVTRSVAGRFSPTPPGRASLLPPDPGRGRPMMSRPIRLPPDADRSPVVAVEKPPRSWRVVDQLIGPRTADRERPYP